MTNSIKSVNCPTCQRKVIWSEQNVFRPFCSERCRLIDFGGWAGEKHSIASEPVFDDDDVEPPNLQ
ncbi:MAG: DNA gyrase inhibitor YacG [Gammaproteobacteria bacterium]|nr:DNA gyrase inhibitor YacG [Gammaproteobacteria bacterium]